MCDTTQTQRLCMSSRMFGFADVNVGEGAPLQSSPGAPSPRSGSLPAYHVTCKLHCCTIATNHSNMQACNTRAVSIAIVLPCSSVQLFLRSGV